MKVLEDWKKICDSASEGPWQRTVDCVKVFYGKGSDDILALCELDLNKQQGKDNAEFIALSRSAMPALIDCLESVEIFLELLDKAFPDTSPNNIIGWNARRLKDEIHARLEWARPFESNLQNPWS